MKEYLRWRVEESLRGAETTVKAFAERAGISMGWLHEFRSSGSCGVPVWLALVDAFDMTIAEALAASREWAATQRAMGRHIEERPQLHESENLKRAIEAFGVVTPNVREKAMAALARFGDRDPDQWMSWIRSIREAGAAGRLRLISRIDKEILDATREPPDEPEP